MTAETDEGGLRYAILGLLDGREFERIRLDVNAVPDDQRPLEHLEQRDLLDFAGIAPPSIPVIPIAQHLAEKLHADVREDGSRSNSRPRDLLRHARDRQITADPRLGRAPGDLLPDLRLTPDHLATNDAGTTHHLGSREGVLRT